jgi:DNA invertase Pin-like site-specific DNA recombinase
MERLWCITFRRTKGQIECTKNLPQNSRMKMIGYARVSRREQKLDLQLRALEAAGCDKIFTDKVSGATTARAGLTQMLKVLEPGDVLVVWKLDRFGRSMQSVVNMVLELHGRGIGFRSITEGIDLTSQTGKLLLSIFGWLAEVERDRTIERTAAAIETARSRGVQLGRKRILTPKDVAKARRLIEAGEETVSGMAKSLKVGRNTLGRALARP